MNAFDASVDRAFAEAVETWTAKWFARGGPRPLSPFGPTSGCKVERDNGTSWHVARKGAAISIASKTTGALAASMIDADLGGTSLTARDRQLIERLTTVCLDDLRGVLGSLFGISAEGGWSADATFALEEDDWVCALGMKDREPLIRLIVRQDLIVSFRKSLICSPMRSAKLQPMAKALEKQRVKLSARLGRCEMMLSDFALLTEGDVLILNTPLDGALELAIDGQAEFSGCVLEQEDERLLLKIPQPLFG